MIPFLVTPDMVMSFPLYISSFQKVRFYFKTEVETMCWVVEPMNMFNHKNIRH